MLHLVALPGLTLRSAERKLAAVSRRWKSIPSMRWVLIYHS